MTGIPVCYLTLQEMLIVMEMLIGGEKGKGFTGIYPEGKQKAVWSIELFPLCWLTMLL